MFTHNTSHFHFANKLVIKIQKWISFYIIYQHRDPIHFPKISFPIHFPKISFPIHFPKISFLIHFPKISFPIHFPKISSPIHFPKIGFLIHFPKISFPIHFPKISFLIQVLKPKTIPGPSLGPVDDVEAVEVLEGQQNTCGVELHLALFEEALSLEDEVQVGEVGHFLREVKMIL